MKRLQAIFPISNSKGNEAALSVSSKAYPMSPTSAHESIHQRKFEAKYLNSGPRLAEDHQNHLLILHILIHILLLLNVSIQTCTNKVLVHMFSYGGLSIFWHI